jgi:hypothetical protein
MSPEQVQQMAAKLVGNASDVFDKAADALESSPDAPQQLAQPEMQTAAISADPPAGEPEALQDTDAATQQAEWAEQAKWEEEEQEPAPTAKARRHGGALPR